jgi:hypothetical protein
MNPEAVSPHLLVALLMIAGACLLPLVWLFFRRPGVPFSTWDAPHLARQRVSQTDRGSPVGLDSCWIGRWLHRLVDNGAC